MQYILIFIVHCLKHVKLEIFLDLLNSIRIVVKVLLKFLELFVYLLVLISFETYSHTRLHALHEFVLQAGLYTHFINYSIVSRVFIGLVFFTFAASHNVIELGLKIVNLRVFVEFGWVASWRPGVCGIMLVVRILTGNCEQRLQLSSSCLYVLKFAHLEKWVV